MLLNHLYPTALWNQCLFILWFWKNDKTKDSTATDEAIGTGDAGVTADPIIMDDEAIMNDLEAMDDLEPPPEYDDFTADR